MRLSKENIPNIRYLDGRRYKVIRIAAQRRRVKAKPLAESIRKAPVLTVVQND